MAGRSSFDVLLFAFAATDTAINSLPIPAFPSIYQTLHLSNSFIGNLNALQSLCALVAGTQTGLLTDTIGPYRLLLVSTVAQMIGFLLCLMSSAMGSHQIFILGRLMPAMFKCSTVVLQTLAVNKALKEKGNISERVGDLGAATNFGFVFSPIIGGWLSSRFSATSPLLCGSFCCILNILLILYMIRCNGFSMPSKPIPVPTSSTTTQAPQLTIHTLSFFSGINLLHVKMAFMLATSIYESFFGQVLKVGPLSMSSQSIGLLLGYIGLVAALASAFLIPVLSQRRFYLKLIPVLAVIMACAMYAWYVATNLTTCIVASTIVSTIGVLFGNVIQTKIAAEFASSPASSNAAVNALALSATADRAARIVAPAFGGYFYAPLFGGERGLGLCGVWCCVTCVTLYFLQTKPRLSTPTKDKDL